MGGREAAPETITDDLSLRFISGDEMGMRHISAQAGAAGCASSWRPRAEYAASVSQASLRRRMLLGLRSEQCKDQASLIAEKEVTHDIRPLPRRE